MRPIGLMLFLLCGIGVVFARSSVGGITDQILDAAASTRDREKVIDANADRAAEIIVEMASRIAPDHANEYDLIPWIWLVANRACKREDDARILRIMEVSMPAGPDDPLLDWQCVVLGGGVVMGIAESGGLPGPRLAELLREQPEDFVRRWEHSLELAVVMSHNEPTPPPTRYDALRMLCVLPFERAEPHLTRYLSPGAEAEVQLGAVYGLIDMDDDRIAAPLIAHLNDLADKNRGVAVKGLTITPGRALALLDAVADGRIDRAAISSFRVRDLREHSDPSVRKRAAEVFGS